MERIYRMRYDYELTLAELFKERFLDELNAWCRACGVKSRIQAYGKGCMPVESLMDVDIPECETWYHKENGEIFPDDKMSGHGYKMVNKFVASGAHLSGKNVVSCEEITNTRFVFNETLERIKITGDLSNLSGVTHSVLHGYNYSPAEAPFPGWVRYGTFYNERNPLWRFFPEWISYKARLSTVLRNSEMQTDIALMQPLVDMWTYLAPQFEPSPGKWRPFYVNTLWEAVHQNGGGCDYLTESILQRSTFADGRIEYGDRSYKALLLLEVETISPETLAAIGRYAAAGGKVFFVGSTPLESPRSGGSRRRRQGGATPDGRPDEAVPRPDPPRRGAAQGTPHRLVQGVAAEIRTDTRRPHRQSAGVRQSEPLQGGNLDIFFFANYSLTEAYTLDTEFNIDLRGRRMWLWDPMTGERALLPDTGTRLKLHLEPTESRLLVFDKPVRGAATATADARLEGPAERRALHWNVTLNHYDGTVAELETDRLFDLGKEKRFESFSGQIVYRTTLDVRPGECAHMEFGVENCVSELYVNGVKAGTVWHGRHVYDVAKLLRPGKNELKLVLTTTLGNYMLSLKENPTMVKWSNFKYKQVVNPCGLTWGPDLYRD